MRKVLLLSPPYVKYYMRNARCDFVSLSRTQWYPIWLGYLGAFLEQKGFTVAIIDAPAYHYSHKQTEQRIISWKPDWLVVYTGRLSEDNDVYFADAIAARLAIDAVFVGPYCSFDPQRLLKKAQKVKYAVQGEFEYPLWELVQDHAPATIANLVYKENEQIIANPIRPLLNRQQLDQIPFVSEFFQKHLDFSKYRTVSEPYPYIDLLIGRGCAWGKCTYCLWVHTFIPGRNYNTRSMDQVIAEIEYIQKNIPQIKSIMIQDDTLTEEIARELSQALLKKRIKIAWSCYARADISLDTLYLMKEAGALNLHVGYECADKTVLRNIKKGLSKERMTQFNQDAKKAKIKIHGDFAIGFPGETKQTIAETIEWACQLRPYTAQFQLMIPFPGTPFYQKLEQEGCLKDGMPDYKEVSKEEMERLAKYAYRKFYISYPYFKQVLRHPIELFFSKTDAYLRAIPSVFWRKYRA